MAPFFEQKRKLWESAGLDLTSTIPLTLTDPLPKNVLQYLRIQRLDESDLNTIALQQIDPKYEKISDSNEVQVLLSLIESFSGLLDSFGTQLEELEERLAQGAYPSGGNAWAAAYVSLGEQRVLRSARKRAEDMLAAVESGSGKEKDMTAIRKVLISEFGGVDKVTVVEDICPTPPPGHVQIATEYSGFTGGDVSMRKGIYPEQKPAPLTPGYCLVGTIRLIGEGCTAVAMKQGDTVAVLTKYDAQAELVNQPEKYCIKVPEGLDHQQVTALLCDWSTAYAMIKHTAKITKGQRVFIHGLSGAVGCGLMILCQLYGAEVYGTAGLRNHDLIRSYGAIPYDYNEKRWVKEMKALGAHAVFDPLGFESFDESYDILTPDGILVAYGNNMDSLGNREPRDPTPAVIKLLARNNPQSTKRTEFFGLTRDAPTYVDDIKALMDMIQRGVIAVPIKKVWAMDDIQTAHTEWGGGNGIGSVLIKVAGV
ncbi:uncharacterized protein GIQ15_03791 [Arthroderma uncinatum]|uniref:uncharacterized protein n=1 Tax=Arthroderma uncinatum TaxID=74035 RepID=UPI00144ADF21|nr:uncharacterized protein GIQ15_03791 [Arthroderma uncinatum]KAF3481032.1 hypothetical protein GIQ15_03791 [Arthroderma uncinatum]